MSTALDSLAPELRAATASPPDGIEQYVGSTMRPGATLEIWCLWEKIGELECKVLTATRLELHARGRFLGRPVDVPGAIELGPASRCTIELGDLRDAEARYCLQHKRPVLISEGFLGYAPSLRFWADGAETKVELRYTVDRFRPRFELTIGPRRPPA